LCVASWNSWNFRSGRVDVGTFAEELLRDLVVTKPEMGVAHDLSLEEAAEFIAELFHLFPGSHNVCVMHSANPRNTW
jgi:hypothetical protein